MTFRTRVLLACIAVAVAPLIVFGLGARRTVGNQLTEQYSTSVAASSSAIQDKLATQDSAIDRRCAHLRNSSMRSRTSVPGCSVMRTAPPFWTTRLR